MKVNEQKKTYHLRSEHSKAEMAIIKSEKIDLKSSTKNNEEHFIIIQRLINQEGTAIVNMHVPNNRALKNMS